mgnify:CR=1 FL=1
MGERPGRTNMIARLLLTVLGVLLTVGPPYAVAFLGLVARFQTEIIAGMLLTSVVVGLVLMYLGIREHEASQ